MGKPPSFLIERARDFLRKAGYPEGTDSNYGYVQLSTPGARLVPGISNRDLTTQLLFWYRESPFPLTPVRSNSPGYINDPPLLYGGDNLVVLDTLGRVRFLRVMSPPDGKPQVTSATPGASSLVAEAGFETAEWTQIDPETSPVFFADMRVAWQGTLKEMPDVPLRIETATYRGRPVSFDVTGLADAAEPLSPTPRTFYITSAAILAILILLFAGTVFLARRNLRLGRGDRRGATRLAFVTMLWSFASWVLSAHHHYLNAPAGIGRLVDTSGFTLVYGGVCWAFYIALEPLVRRRWPSVLVSWTRLLSGQWSDPLVGRDVFAGCAFGVLQFVCVDRLLVVGPASAPGLLGIQLTGALGVGWFLSQLLIFLATSTLFALGILCLFTILRMLVRNEMVAVSGFVLVPAAVTLVRFMGAPVSPWIGVASVLVFLTLLLFALMRFGLVTVAMMTLVESILWAYPMTLQSSLWYSPASYGAFIVIALIALYGFRTSLAGRPILNAMADD
jgi:serine/threonine-protein kinase